jgi:hypothetical protein
LSDMCDARIDVMHLLGERHVTPGPRDQSSGALTSSMVSPVS